LETGRYESWVSHTHFMGRHAYCDRVKVRLG